jgi:hypothetical protein
VKRKLRRGNILIFPASDEIVEGLKRKRNIVAEHLTKQHIEACRAGELSADRLPYVYDHIAVCEACRKIVGGVSQLRASLDNWKNDFAIEPLDHIPYEQIAAYIDAKIDDVEREIVESHIKVCGQCSREAQDLKAFSAEFTPALANESTVERLTISTPVEQTASPGLWEKFAAFWRAPKYWIPLQLASTAAAILLCVWLATNALRSENTELKTELAKVREENDVLQQEFNATNSTIENLQAQLSDLQQSNLKPGDGNALVALLNDGADQITLDKAGNLTGLKSLPPVYQQMVKTSILTERLQTPSAISSLIGRAGTLMGGAGEGVAFALLSPVGTNVSTDHPTFRWRALKGAVSYLVAVYDENFNYVATSQPITTTSWTVPKALKRGAIYFWQVSAMKDGKEIKSPVPPAPEAKFRVIEQTKADELSQLKKSSANSHLAAGLIYARDGLLDDAEREFELLVQANPKSAIARKLLSNVKALRRAK